MIKYSLGCDKDHEFEGWFSGSDEFERLTENGLLDCPVCGSHKISKLLMAPSVKSTKGKDQIQVSAQQVPGAPTSDPSANVSMAASPAMPSIPPEVREKVIEHLREIKKHVQANAENVGDKFTEEARKIHYGESEQRGIYGSATPKDAVELMEEGIEIMPLPVLPEDKN